MKKIILIIIILLIGIGVVLYFGFDRDAVDPVERDIPESSDIDNPETQAEAPTPEQEPEPAEESPVVETEAEPQAPAISPETSTEARKPPKLDPSTGLTSDGFKPNLPLDDPSIEVYNGVVDPRSIDVHVLSDVNIESVVNKYNALPDDYAPTNLVAIDANGVGGMMLQAEAAEAWEKWRQAALDDGFTVLAVSTYRTQDYQSGLFHNYLNNFGLDALLFSAYPRRSEHEMGLAADLSYNYELPGEAFIDMPMGRYLADTAHQYGFILRYPKGYEADTGYAFEPWHYRYVGTKIAKAMHDEKIPTLEHYYGLNVK